VFLSAFHSNYVPILHRFWDIARYWSKIADFNLPHLYLAPPWVTPLEFRRDPWRQKTKSSWTVVWRCLRDPIGLMFSRFGTIPACDGRTDRRTRDVSIYRASIASRGKNDGCNRPVIDRSRRAYVIWRPFRSIYDVFLHHTRSAREPLRISCTDFCRQDTLLVT